MKKTALPLCALLLAALLAGCTAAPATAVPVVTEYKGENTIPYPTGYDTKSSGASSYQNCGDHLTSPYFAHPDVYNMKSTDTLTLLPQFKTYQQTTEWSCGNATAVMVLNHYGNTQWDELEIADIMRSNQDLDGDNTETPGEANEQGEWGTSTTGVVTFFTQIGWNVQSSIDEGQKDFQESLADPAVFTQWVTENLKDNTPVMVEWIDWGGHWQAIIGYDTMGTDDNFEDDVLILADPYDATDSLQDGYYIFSASRFYYMWFDAHILPTDQQTMQWVIAKP